MIILTKSNIGDVTLGRSAELNFNANDFITLVNRKINHSLRDQINAALEAS